MNRDVSLLSCFLLLVGAILGSMVGIDHLMTETEHHANAMFADPSLPFVGLDRVVAQAPNGVSRQAWVDAREEVESRFRAPLWLIGNVWTAPRDLWTFAHADPATLFQLLGGQAAYDRAMVTALHDLRTEQQHDGEVANALASMIAAGH